MGLRVELGRGIAKVKGRDRVTGVAICLHAGEGAVLEEIACDAVAMSGGWSPGRAPVVPLRRQAGLGRGGRDVPPRPAAGRRPALTARASSCRRCRERAPGNGGDPADATEPPSPRRRPSAVGRGDEPTPGSTETEEAPLLPVWTMPEGAGPCAAVQDVARLPERREGLGRRARRARGLRERRACQALYHARDGDGPGEAQQHQWPGGPVSGAERADSAGRHDHLPAALHADLDGIAIAGVARGDLFQPLRRTPIHAWHEAHGADFEPVGQWRRPYCYPPVRRDPRGRGDPRGEEHPASPWPA